MTGMQEAGAAAFHADFATTLKPRPESDVQPSLAWNCITDAQGLSFYPCVRRAYDIVFASLMLVLTAPLLLLAVFLVKLTSCGPAIYSQVRVGRFGKPFTIYKVRTMTHDAEKDGARWCLPGDSRVTRIGRWLRASKIDELPQLWNVIRGDMSLIGPRPERPEFVPHLQKAILGHRGRLAVRPGVTGLAQVQLPADTDLESVRLKLAHDLYYVNCATLWLDLRIAWATVFCLLGTPFRLVRVLFGFPSKESVERAYRRALEIASAA